MRFDKFGLFAIIFGLLLLAGVTHFAYAWNITAFLMALVTGLVISFGLFMLLIGLLLIFL